VLQLAPSLAEKTTMALEMTSEAVDFCGLSDVITHPRLAKTMVLEYLFTYIHKTPKVITQ
jgi:hypothetical protein